MISGGFQTEIEMCGEKSLPHVFSQTFMGQPQFQDMMGNYMFVQFENGTNNIMVAGGGIMKECTPVSQQDYLNYVALIGTAPGLDDSYSSGGGSSSSGSGSTYKPTYVEKTITCTACKGTGKSLARKTAPKYGVDRSKVYCEICNDYLYSHYHETCSVCKGSGSVTRMVKNK